MEEALELESFLPASFGTASELVYMQFLWKAFQDTRYSSHHHFASIEALHESHCSSYVEEESPEPATATP